MFCSLAQGKCEGAIKTTCDDGNPCTDNTCDDMTGCGFAPNTAFCDDLDPCTVPDMCVNSVCTGGPPVSCFDDNPCTTDSCSPALGCVNADVPDGNPCIVGVPYWECLGGTCTCKPDCSGKVCGPDGCSGNCGPCAGICTVDGQCV